MIVPMALAALVSQCAPHVGPMTMTAIVEYESSWHATAIGDNTAHRSYAPTTRAQAEALAESLLAAGHNLDLGLAQVNSANLPGLHLTVHQIFDPCTNLEAGSHILRGSYKWAAGVYGPGQTALWHALEAYNSGRLNGHPSYAAGVFALAARDVIPELPSLPSIGKPLLAPGARVVGVTAVRPTHSVLVWQKAAPRTSVPVTATRLLYFSDVPMRLPAATRPHVGPKE